MMIETRLTYLTDCFEHIDAVQDLPANPCSPRSAMPITRLGFFPQKFAGHIRCFLKRKVARFISSKSLVIPSLCYLIYCHRLRNLNALSTGLSYQIQILRTICSKLFGICYRLAREGRYRPTLDCGAKKLLLNAESVFAFKFFQSIKSFEIQKGRD